MLFKSHGFTILESMLGLLLASLLIATLLVTFIAFKECYKRVMVVSTLQDDGRFAISILRRNINRAEDVMQVISQENVSAKMRSNLKNKSDVLILKEKDQDMAFYLAQAGWKPDGHHVSALFKKPFEGKRQELISHVTKLHFKSSLGGISYNLTVRSVAPVLKFINKFTGQFLYRTWYGFAAIGINHAA
jgi:hypothetical protein